MIYPIYKSTFERGDEVTSDYPNLTNAYREHVIAWAKDVRRTVDYLETRPDIDRDRIASRLQLGSGDGADLSGRRAAVQDGRR